MEEALRFFRAFEVWIYVLLGLGGLFYVRKFIQAWQELRGAAFGLERQNAQARLNQSASALVLVFTLMIAEFVLVSFIAPTFPGSSSLATPTLNLLATPTTTLAPETTSVAQPGGVITATLTAPVEVGDGNCVPDTIMITSPSNGQEISGVIEIRGTANIPNFGFYKYEMKRPQDTIWSTIQAGNTIKQDEALGDWDTRRLSPGEYQLGLVVVDNEGNSSPPCVVQVRVAMAAETPEP